MLSRNTSAAVLLLLALGFAAANLWLTAARSTIPLGLQGRIISMSLLPEKTAGLDDVFLVHLDTGQVVQVDQSVFDAVQAGDFVQKQAWSRQLEVNDRLIDLTWSRDFRGMLWAMPLVTLVMLCAALLPSIASQARPSAPQE